MYNYNNKAWKAKVKVKETDPMWSQSRLFPATYCLGFCDVMVKLGVLGMFWAGKIGEMLSTSYFLKKKISFSPNLINDHDHPPPSSCWDYKKMMASVQWIQPPFCVHCVYTLFFILLTILWSTITILIFQMRKVRHQESLNLPANTQSAAGGSI